jgi:hypothetical protein
MSTRYAHDWRESQRVQTCMDKDAWSSWHSPSLSLPYVPSVFTQKRKRNTRAYDEIDGLKRGKTRESEGVNEIDVYLFQSLVVDKTGSIFGNLKLALLNLLAKFPAVQIAM